MVTTNDKPQPQAPNWDYECENLIKFPGLVGGVDEAGRGPLAGPVVAGAVILNPDKIPTGLNDSKKLTEAKREELFEQLTKSAHIGVGIVSPQEIDEINILQATLKAMTLAVEDLPLKPQSLLIDGNRAPKLSYPMQTIVKGDSKSLSIAAASIIAKVTRDRIMLELDEAYPTYGFARHKGYGTKIHKQALEDYGPCPAHRFSFAPVKQASSS